MSARLKLSLLASVAPSSSASSVANFDMSDAGSSGGLYDIVRALEEDAGPGTLLGQAWRSLDVPANVLAFGLASLDKAELGIRLGGAVASVTGAAGTFALSGSETLGLVIDQAAQVNVVFVAGDTTATKAAARINAAVGAIVATVTAAGQLQISGVNTGGLEASARGWSYGRVAVASGGTALAALGLTAGTAYGSGRDISTNSRLWLEFPQAPAVATMKISKIEVSGTGRIATIVAGSLS